jgi:hypothetical protein
MSPISDSLESYVFRLVVELYSYAFALRVLAADFPYLIDFQGSLSYF